VVTQSQGWLLNYVLDNYRRNGFKLGVGAVDARDALFLLDKVRPDMIKVDAREITYPADIERLLIKAATSGVQIVFKRVENPQVAQLLTELSAVLGQTVYGQGYIWDMPGSTLATTENSGSALTHNKVA